ncbi:MAG: HDOD domain-containing protein [Woeseiaceae bacterium]|nr:HDOD domain-containing protein [Woeseiaceae bacterium]
MSRDEHFQFVQSLARELNRKEITLTSFPDVVMRVRKALDEPDTSAEQIAEILGVDPALASRVLVLSNSSFHNPRGIKIESLNSAVGRIGLNEIRTIAIAYAVEQIHASQNLDALKDELRNAWSVALRLAAMSHVIAEQCTKLDRDSAFVAGLLNQVGVLYIFSKHDEYPSLLQDPEARQSLVDEWTAPIGESIVTNWDFSDDIRESINPDQDEQVRRGTKANLADVVIAAKLMLEEGEGNVTSTPEARRLALTDDQLPLLSEAYQEKLDSLVSSVR